MRFFFINLVLACLLFSFAPTYARKNKCSANVVTLKELVAHPNKYKNKKVCFEGRFAAFSALALDYPKAMKDSEDYFGILLSRPDIEKIPLVELKLALLTKNFEENKIISQMEHGDKLLLGGKVFSTVFDEPWVEINSVDILEKVESEDEG